MATIRASCPDCGDVELTTDDVTVRVCAENNEGSYTFRCPKDNMVVVKPAESRIVELLVASGVRLETWHLPKEFDERPKGELLSESEILDYIIDANRPEGGDPWDGELRKLLADAGVALDPLVEGPGTIPGMGPEGLDGPGLPPEALA